MATKNVLILTYAWFFHQNESSLRDVLELPHLMDVCARNELYEEALDLESYARTLYQRHSDVPLLANVVS